MRATGSVADYALRAGRGVTLICHGASHHQVRLTPDGGGRRTLLETLAQTEANAAAPLALAVRRLLTDRLSALRSQSLTLVGMTLDAQMARALISLREDGVQLNFLYVPGFSFAGNGRPLPFLPPPGRGRGGDAGEAGGARGGAQPRPQPGELPGRDPRPVAAALIRGVRCATLAYGDDLVHSLSAWQSGRPGRAAAR